MQKIAAAIVIHNPDLDRFQECMASIGSQVEKIYVYDNREIEENSNKSIRSRGWGEQENVVCLSSGHNDGIAKALNIAFDRAMKDGYDWIITMDQDSIVPDNLISRYREIIAREDENLGIICPQVIDKRRSYMEIKMEPSEEYVDECITSASCTSVRLWNKIGGFDEWLFIDLVDNEFCKRLIVSGYKIVRLNDLILDQEFGKIIPKSEKVQKFWIKLSKLLKNDNVAKFSYRKFVNPMRVYYTSRNIIYVNRKLKLYGKTAYSNYNCKGYTGFVISFLIPSFLRAQDKTRVLWAIIKGTGDGLQKKAVVWRID